jgi:hypothetical protein
MWDKTLKEFVRSRQFTAVIIALGLVITLLIVLRLGIAIGYQRAIFASRFGEQYQNNFVGPRRTPPGFGGPMMDAHGGFGEILKIDSNLITVRDQDGTEKSILSSTSTTIREFSNTLSLSDLKVGENIAVIGEPNSSGQVDARLIRVIPQPGPAQQTPSTWAASSTGSI